MLGAAVAHLQGDVTLPGGHLRLEEIFHWQAQRLEQLGSRPVERLPQGLSSVFSRGNADYLQASSDKL